MRTYVHTCVQTGVVNKKAAVKWIYNALLLHIKRYLLFFFVAFLPSYDSRPNISQFQSLKVHRLTFLNGKKFLDRRIVRLKTCETFSRTVCIAFETHSNKLVKLTPLVWIKRSFFFFSFRFCAATLYTNLVLPSTTLIQINIHTYTKKRK